MLGTLRLALSLIEDLTTSQAGLSSLSQVDSNLIDTVMATEEKAEMVEIGMLESLDCPSRIDSTDLVISIVNIHLAIDEVEIQTPEILEDLLIAARVLNANVSDSIHLDGLLIRPAKIWRELQTATA
jgi:hypothetical protein